MVSPERHAPIDHARRLLADCILFRGLVENERDAVVSRARLRHFAAGETIFLMGSPGDSMMAVLSGQVRISVPSPEGREIVLAIFQPGEVFGEIALLDGKERTADARAMAACDLAILERRDVFAFLERKPNAWPRLVEVLCDRLRTTDQHIAEVALLQLPVRLAKALLGIADAEVAGVSRGTTCTVRLSQRVLRNLAGAPGEPVSKCLPDWQRPCP